MMKLRAVNQKHRRLRLLLATVFLLASLIGCAPKQKTLMTLGKQTLSVNQYELLLSRMRGQLEYNSYPVDSDDFWKTIWSTDGATYEQYFGESILQQAKDMLVKLYLFEEVYGLTLPDSNAEEIDRYIEDALSMEFDGSKSSFNRALSAYGVNMEMLRENYLMEDKITYLTNYIASITGDSAKEEYYEQNYVCFRQIIFPLYEYVWETDENGDVIYYLEGSNHIAYNKTSGTPRTGTDGKQATDENGDTVYYTADGKIAYDTKDGVPMAKDENNDGYADYRTLGEEEAAAVAERAGKLYELIAAGDFSTFESYGDDLSDDDIWATYQNGIFLRKDENYSADYLNDIAEALEKMEVGDTALIQSENAYHLIMKYALEEGAYKQSANEDWFSDFNEMLGAQILETLCAPYMEQITVNETALAGARSIRELGSNHYY